MWLTGLKAPTNTKSVSVFVMLKLDTVVKKKT